MLMFAFVGESMNRPRNMLVGQSHLGLSFLELLKNFQMGRVHLKLAMKSLVSLYLKPMLMKF